MPIISDSQKLMYFFMNILMIISAVYLMVAIASKVRHKSKSAAAISATFSTVSIFIGFSLLFHMFATTIGTPVAFALVLTMIIPVYAALSVLGIHLKTGAAIILISSICFMGVISDCSEEYNFLTITKRYTTKAYEGIQTKSLN